MPKLICIKIYNTRVAGEMAKGLLESNDIKACISGIHHAGPHLEFAAGIRLWVGEADKTRALDILKSYDRQSR